MTLSSGARRIRRVFRLGLGRDVEREVDDEIAFHLERRVERLMADGLGPDAARREALRQFGAVAPVRDSCVTLDRQRERAMRRADLFGELRQDLTFACRMLRHNLAFSVAVVATLAVGIGANGAIFTLINAVLLRPLPVHAPEQLIAIGNPMRVASHSEDDAPHADLISYPMYRRLRDQQHFVTGLLASGRTGSLAVRDSQTAGAVDRPSGRFVSGNYFEVLGVRAAAGRTFDASADRGVGVAPVVTISDGYWTRRFNRDPAAIGRALFINRVRFTIVGVAPASFTGEIVGASTDIWIPITMQPVLMPNQPLLDSSKDWWLLLLGRLAPGVTAEQAHAGLGTILRQFLEEQTPGVAGAERVRKLPMFIGSGARGFSRVRGTYAMPLKTLMGGVAVLMLLICVNVANLLLARGVARRREMSVRLALGAARSRLVRQLITENLLLAILGAAAGLAVATWGSGVLLNAVSTGNTLPIDVRPDLRVLAFTMGTAALAVLLFGLVPALRASRVDLASSMRAAAGSLSGALGGARSGRSAGALLIAAQVALSVVLLLGAGLLVRSLRSVQNSDAGLDRDHLLIVDVDVRSRGYAGDRLRPLVRQLVDGFSGIPGVAAVSYSENGIFAGTESNGVVIPDGFVATAPEDTTAKSDRAGAGYVHAIGGRILEGRDITAQDEDQNAPVVLINATMARFYFPHGSAVGKSVRLSGGVVAQIIGVVADVKDHALGAPPVRRFYTPYLQSAGGFPQTLRFAVRTSGNPATVAKAVRDQVLAADRALPIGMLVPLSVLMQASIRQERLLAGLSTAFGTLALVLAALGLYGVMAYAVTRRTAEMGLRAALGAQRGALVRMVLLDAVRLLVGGVAIGIPLALVAARLLRNQLHGIETTDPAALAGALAVLTSAGLLAALIPALRAARVSPIVALRQE